MARLSAIAGPVYLILAKLEKKSIPSPTITVPAEATRAPPTWSIASRRASDRDRPRRSSSRVPRDQEQAVVRPRPEEDDHDEDLRDVDDLEAEPGTVVNRAIDRSETITDSAIVTSGTIASSGER